MIPRHPGDPERLPKVSRGAVAAPGLFRLGGSRCSGKGASGHPKPRAHGKAGGDPSARPDVAPRAGGGPSGLWSASHLQRPCF